MFKAESQSSEKHLAYKVKSDSFQQEVKAKCVKTKYTWANEVLAGIEYSRYLMSSNSVYGKCCSVEFRLGKYPADCYEPLSKNRKTVSSQMFDIKREDAFLQTVNYLLKNDEEQLTIHDLITKMGQLCKTYLASNP